MEWRRSWDDKPVNGQKKYYVQFRNSSDQTAQVEYCLESGDQTATCTPNTVIAIGSGQSVTVVQWYPVNPDKWNSITARVQLRTASSTAPSDHVNIAVAPQPSQPASDPDREAREREAKEQKAVEQVAGEEDERAQERTRAYNNQKSGKGGTASSAELSAEDERTQAFNQQKSQAKKGNLEGTPAHPYVDFEGDPSGITAKEIARKGRKVTEPWLYQHPPKDGQETNGCVWTSGSYRATIWGDDNLFMDASATAFITDRTGSPTASGHFLTIFNGSPHPLWFGRSGVINEMIQPGLTRVFYLPIYTNRKSPPIEVGLYVRYCKEQ